MNWLKKLTGRMTNQVEEKQIALREGSPEFHLFVASTTLDSGAGLAHGASHLASLLAVDPGRAEWQALAARYLAAASGDVDALLPIGEQRFAHNEALRAWFWQCQGRTMEAVDLLLQTSRAAGHAIYLHA